MKLYDDEELYANAARLGPVLRRELDAIAARLAVDDVRARRSACSRRSRPRRRPTAGSSSARELAARKLSLHVDGKRGTAIFAPPLCITEDELVRGVRSFGEAAVAAFGGAA